MLQDSLVLIVPTKILLQLPKSSRINLSIFACSVECLAWRNSALATVLPAFSYSFATWPTRGRFLHCQGQHLPDMYSIVGDQQIDCFPLFWPRRNLRFLSARKKRLSIVLYACLTHSFLHIELFCLFLKKYMSYKCSYVIF